MKKAEKILEKHIVLNDCIGYLGSDGRLYKAIIDALNEAINYTHSCTELCEHKNETMRQGDGFTYSVCSDCGDEV